MWAVGCIYAELLALRPIFKGEEAKIDAHQSRQQAMITQAAGGFFGVKTLPFQSDQMGKIVEILGSPDKIRWPDISCMPEYPQFAKQER